MAEERRHWRRYEVNKLIKDFRARANLWNPKDLDYQNPVKKIEAFKEIAYIYGTTATEVERKIKILIAQYHRERRNYKKMKKSRGGHVFKTQWFGYQAMSFLHDKKKARKEAEIAVAYECDDSSEEEIEGTQSDTQDIIEQHESGSETEGSQLIADVNTAHSFEGRITATMNVGTQVPDASEDGSEIKLNKDGNYTNESARVFEMLKYVLEKKENQENLLPKRDEYDVFGETVACSIRALQSDYLKIIVQHRINSLLYQARIVSYNLPHNSQFFTPLHASPTFMSDQPISPVPDDETASNILQWPFEPSLGSDTSNYNSIQY